jgi:hypothetical protein
MVDSTFLLASAVERGQGSIPGPGSGGAGGGGGHGGGGAGGTIMFKSTLFSAAGGTINASGGSSAGNAGGNGRYVASENSSALVNYGSRVGVSELFFSGHAALDVNPFIQTSGTTTFNIAGLQGGADLYGLMSGVSASDSFFDSVRTGAPANALAAIVRRSIGPTGDNYLGEDQLLLVNLTATSLASPMLGLSAAGSDFISPLLTRGFNRNPAFGGAGPQVLSTLPAGGVYATLAPSGSTLQVHAIVANTAVDNVTFGTLNVAYLLPLAGDFNSNGLLDAPDVPAMLKALTDVPGFKSTRGLSDAALLGLGDLNGDNKFTNADIQPLLNALATGGGSIEAVPEPASLLLAMSCAVAAACIRCRAFRGLVSAM